MKNPIHDGFAYKETAILHKRVERAKNMLHILSLSTRETLIQMLERTMPVHYKIAVEDLLRELSHSYHTTGI